MWTICRLCGGSGRFMVHSGHIVQPSDSRSDISASRSRSSCFLVKVQMQPSKTHAERLLFRSCVSVTYSVPDTLYDGNGNGKQLGCTSAVSSRLIVPRRYWLFAQWSGVCWLHKVLRDSMQFSTIQWAQINLRRHYIPFHRKQKKNNNKYEPNMSRTFGSWTAEAFHRWKLSDCCVESLQCVAMFLCTCNSKQHQWQLLTFRDATCSRHLVLPKKSTSHVKNCMCFMIAATVSKSEILWVMLLEFQNKGIC